MSVQSTEWWWWPCFLIWVHGHREINIIGSAQENSLSDLETIATCGSWKKDITWTTCWFPTLFCFWKKEKKKKINNDYEWYFWNAFYICDVKIKEQLKYEIILLLFGNWKFILPRTAELLILEDQIKVSADRCK